MNKTTDKFLESLEKKDTHPVVMVIDHANNKLYYQTEPFVRDGQVVIKRLAEYDIVIETAYEIVSEKDRKTSLKKAKATSKAWSKLKTKGKNHER